LAVIPGRVEDANVRCAIAHRGIARFRVSSAEDAYAKVRLGASLVQLLTALIYRGPGVVRTITRGLAQLLARDGVKHVADVVGVDAI
jgi:hypothetical protein